MTDAQYDVVVETRPSDDEDFAAEVRAAIDSFSSAPPTGLEEDAVLGMLRERWPDAGLNVTLRRPTSRRGVVVWTVWRDPTLADRDRTRLYDPPRTPR